MIQFVNAKINLGLNIVSRREDGYHDLETVFYPVGLESGTPQQPEPFDDIIEVVADKGKTPGCRFRIMGQQIDCAPENNLVVKAGRLFFEEYSKRFDDIGSYGLFDIILDKHLPSGAGLGGGSADASFMLSMLNDFTGNLIAPNELAAMALRLGADCPFFLYNKPCFAEGVGERLTPLDINLDGKNLLIVKPEIAVSTKDAFSGIVPRKPLFDLRFLPHLPLEKWRGKVVNDFEETIFPKYPLLGEIKATLYNSGAIYASMSGSGSALYGIFDDEEKAKDICLRFKSNYNDVWLFRL